MSAFEPSGHPKSRRRLPARASEAPRGAIVKAIRVRSAKVLRRNLPKRSLPRLIPFTVPTPPSTSRAPCWRTQDRVLEPLKATFRLSHHCCRKEGPEHRRKRGRDFPGTTLEAGAAIQEKLLT